MKTLALLISFLFITNYSNSQTVQQSDTIANLELIQAANTAQIGMGATIIGATLGSMIAFSMSTSGQNPAPAFIIVAISEIIGIGCEYSAWEHIKKAGLQKIPIKN